jgi:sugar phosphate isomerase/epimerase
MPEMRTATLSHARLMRLLAAEAELGMRLIALEPETQVADLGDLEMRRIAECERELGVVLVAHRADAAPAQLRDEDVKSVRRLEKRLGCCLIAYEDPTEAQSYRWASMPRQLAKLTDAQLTILQRVERELQAVVLALDAPPFPSVG